MSSEADIAKITEEIGDFGMYQKWLFILSCSAMMFSGISLGTTIFVSTEVDYRCFVPECESDIGSPYSASFLNFTIPYNGEKLYWEQCQKYATMKSVNDSEDNTYCDSDLFTSTESTVKCSDWIHDTSILGSTVVTEFNLVCDHSWLRPAVTSVLMCGRFFGSVLLGDLADRIGRRKALVVAAVILSAGGLTSSFAFNFPVFVIFKFIEGAGNSAVVAGAYLLAVEFVSSKWRSFCGMMIMIPFAIGEATVALMAYFLRDWRRLQFITSVLPLIILSYWWLMPESIRWLLSRGRVKEAMEIVKMIMKFNKLEQTQDIYQISEETENENEKTENGNEKTFSTSTGDRKAMDLFRSPVLRKRTINLWYCWISITLTYYGLTTNTTSLAGNHFVNFAAIMLIEIPAFIFGYFLLDKIGRKGTLILTLWFGGIACFVSGFTPNEFNFLIVGMSTVGKFGVSAAFGAIYTFTSELYPTSLRAFGLGLCSAVSCIGSVLAPMLANLSQVYASLPLYIFGSFAVTSGTLMILLPETLGSELPQTMAESEKLGRAQAVMHFACCRPRKIAKSEGTSEFDTVTETRNTRHT